MCTDMLLGGGIVLQGLRALGEKVNQLSHGVAQNARETSAIRKRVDSMADAVEKIANWVDAQPPKRSS